MKHNEFDNEEKYRLYRTVRDLLHPSISKKNISNYKIIINDDILPLRIFYPKRVTNIEHIMLFIHGDSNITGCHKNYAEISSTFSKEFNNLVISIDYDNYTILPKKEVNRKIYNTIKKIYKDLLNINIKYENITLLGDSTSATTILTLTKKMNKENIVFGKYILFYPPVSGEYINNKIDTSYDLNLFPKLREFYKRKRKSSFPINDTGVTLPKTLILCGNIDPLIDELREYVKIKNNTKLVEICSAKHGFLNSKDKDVINEYQATIKNFII